MKSSVYKYHVVAKDFAKNHSVGDEPWSEASFIEGFNQACQWLEPDESLVQCPKCNTAHVSLLDIKELENLPAVQYPKGMGARFRCLRCQNEWKTNLNLNK